MDFGQEAAATNATEGYRRELSMLSNQCKETLQSAEMYRMLPSSSAEYGPYLQTVDDLNFNSDGEAVANLKPQQWAANMAEVLPNLLQSIQRHLMELFTWPPLN